MFECKIQCGLDWKHTHGYSYLSSFMKEATMKPMAEDHENGRCMKSTKKKQKQPDRSAKCE